MATWLCFEDGKWFDTTSEIEIALVECYESYEWLRLSEDVAKQSAQLAEELNSAQSRLRNKSCAILAVFDGPPLMHLIVGWRSAELGHIL
jgi:hypothetical protein